MWTALEKEQHVGNHLRVRRWSHRGAERLSAPEAVHHAVELCWVDEGGAAYEVSGQRHDVRPGQLMVVPAGVEHSTAFLAHSRANSIWLGADAIAQLEDCVGQGGALTAGLSERPEPLIALGRLLQSEAFETDAGALMSADALSEALALKLLRAHPRAQGSARSPGVRRALDHIEAHYAEPLSLDDLARTAAMSRFHFSRCFQREVGASPYAKLQQVRLARAAELLARGRANVTEAAYASGFTDLGRFGRKFRERYGCTPGRFARARA